MAYARFYKPEDWPNETEDFPASDVYVIGTAKCLECIACRLVPKGGWYDIFMTKSRFDMFTHLQEHRAEGHKVPQDALDRLNEELHTVGNTY